jgi:cytochrome oxidase Cu insertion factor (SCO1/SenC/PrrC family)
MSMTRTETVVWGAVVAALAGVVALAVVARSGREPAADEPESAGVAPERTSALLPRPMGDFGDAACVERSGKAMRTSDLHGKFVVADFVFTYCSGPCPRMTGAMKELQEVAKAMDDVRLATFTVDPDKDTPEALAAYADRVGADKDRWLFLNCKRAALQEIAYDHLHIVNDREDLFSHSTMFVLADRQGLVRAFYSPLSDPKWLAKLTADLATLRREPAR